MHDEGFIILEIQRYVSKKEQVTSVSQKVKETVIRRLENVL